MTRTEAENAVKHSLLVHSFLCDAAGVVKGWANPDQLFVQWDGHDHMDTEDYDSLEIAG